MSITDKHLYGWSQEIKLKGRLEELLGEEITKHEKRFYTWDYSSEDYHIELKSRMDQYDEYSHDTWYVPECKTKNLKKDLIIFYHFGKTDSLFYIIYQEELFKAYKIVLNKNGQRTICIPREDFIKV